MVWQLRIAERVRKALEKLPVKDRARLLAALKGMEQNPFNGDIARLRSERTAWRRRVGNYRLFFDVYPEQQLVDVVALERRTSTTY